jgi:hypothetical protein
MTARLSGRCRTPSLPVLRPDRSPIDRVFSFAAKRAIPKQVQDRICFRISPRERRSIMKACAALQYSQGALMRKVLEAVLKAYDSETPPTVSQLEAAVTHASQHVPPQTGLAYDPREYMRLWHAGRVRERTRNTVDGEKAKPTVAIAVAPNLIGRPTPLKPRGSDDPIRGPQRRFRE